LFAAAITLLTYFGRQLKNEKAHLLYFLNHSSSVSLFRQHFRVTRKLLSLFLTTEESQVREIVYVEYPKEGMWVPAYANRYLHKS
jgi:uncharacterized membrane protein